VADIVTHNTIRLTYFNISRGGRLDAGPTGPPSKCQAARWPSPLRALNICGVKMNELITIRGKVIYSHTTETTTELVSLQIFLRELANISAIHVRVSE